MAFVRMTLPTVAAIAAAGVLGACGQAQPTSDPAAAPERTGSPAATTPATPTTSGLPTPPARGQLRTIVTGLAVPWDIAFLPDGDALVSERDSARIVRIPAGGGRAQTVLRVPGVVPGGEGGLLGLAVSPRYASDDDVYAYFTAESDNRIARIDLRTRRVTPILTGLRKGQIHNGGALSFGPDGRLYAGVGETGDPPLAQDRASRNGKILRITTSGRPAPGNPFAGSPVWSYGHRNIQGLAWDRAGRLWATEFGQTTTDEVNLIEAGRNYGWPVVEGEGSTQGGRFTSPQVTWSPTSESSPSGAAISGRELYVGALAGRRLWRIPLTRGRADAPQALFTERYGRVRAVATAPDGSIWFSTSNRDGRGDPQDGDDRILQLGT
jgi:glucose/arabinose dehydrogenase